MRKQILLVEFDDQLRTAAETVLRQGGFEVVSVDSAARADGILGVSSFDLAIVGVAVEGESGPFALEWINNKERSNSPFLILCGQDNPYPDIPAEHVVGAPFDPATMIIRVCELTGEPIPELTPVIEEPEAPSEVVDPAGVMQAPSGQPAPVGQPSAGDQLFGTGGIGDDFLDAAFGLDQLEVNEAETLGAGETTEVPLKKRSESLVGYDADVTDVSSVQHEMTESGVISNAKVREAHEGKPAVKVTRADVNLQTGQIPTIDAIAEQAAQNTDANVAPPTPPPPPAPVSAKEAPQMAPQATPPPAPSPATPTPQAPPVQPQRPAVGDHDYEWFMSQMQDGAAAPQQPQQQAQTPQIPKAQPAQPQAPSPEMSDKSDIEVPRPTPDQFAKMVREDVSKSKPGNESKSPKRPEVVSNTDNVFDWSDTDDDPAGIFTEQMAKEIAKQVADRLMKQLNSEKFAQLIRSEIKKYMDKHSASS